MCSLRRRFQQNQEDCTITVLELFTDDRRECYRGASCRTHFQRNPTEEGGEKWGKVLPTSDVAPSDLSSSTPSAADEDGRSMKSFQSESYVHASQMDKSSSGLSGDQPPRTKAQLWNDLKITGQYLCWKPIRLHRLTFSAIARAFTLIYSLALLTLLTRIQLNLLGRRNYLASVVSLANQSPNEPTIHLENRDDDNAERAYGNDFETNRQYLTFSWWLLHRGWRDIMTKVEAAVKDAFGSLKPTEDLPLTRLSSLILDVRRQVEGSTPDERKYVPYICI